MGWKGAEMPPSFMGTRRSALRNTRTISVGSCFISLIQEEGEQVESSREDGTSGE